MGNNNNNCFKLEQKYVININLLYVLYMQSCKLVMHEFVHVLFTVMGFVY